MKRNILLSLICFLLTLLFAYAAFSKIFIFAEFKSQLGASDLLKTYASVLAWLVPGLELCIAVMLSVMSTRLTGLYFSFLLLFMFTLYIAGMLLTAQHLPCSCGGLMQSMSWKQHLYFNLFFMGLSITGIVLWKSKLYLPSQKNISREKKEGS